MKKYADTLIGSREAAMLRDLGDLFSRRGRCNYKLTTKVKCGNREGAIDLLAYNPKFPDELLLVEAKANLGADEINEVDHATEEMRKGQRQVQNAASILRGRLEIGLPRRPVVSLSSRHERAEALPE